MMTGFMVRPPHRECQRKCDNPDHINNRGCWSFEQLSLHHHGRWILNMAVSSQRYTDLLPLLHRSTHSATICWHTGSGKTVFLLEGPYRGFFRHIVVLHPTIRHNKIYHQRPRIWTDPEVYVLDPGERLHDYLRAYYQVFASQLSLYIMDNCSATKALMKKKDMLSELAFSGRHADQSVWVLTQKYNSVLKDLREQTRWVALFHCEDRDSYEDCLPRKWCDPHTRTAGVGAAAASRDEAC